MVLKEQYTILNAILGILINIVVILLAIVF